MSLRDVFEGIGTLWGWFLDLPLFFSIPLAFVAASIVLVGVLLMLGSNSDTSA